MAKQRRCKDCGTEDIILKVIPKNNDISNISVDLCSACLTQRAQIQQIKEDKLPFPKLLAKIRSETAKRIRSDIARDDVLYKLRNRMYKGTAPRYNEYSNISQYWVEQLTLET